MQYGARNLRTGWSALPPAILRAGAMTLLVALLLDAPASPAKPVRGWAAIDASASMRRGDSALWRAARDTVRRIAAESVFAFGDSARRGDTMSVPRDLASRLRPMVERALGSGRPLTVVTDGELDDPDAVRSLPAGSRVVLLTHPTARDLAISSIDVPRAVVSGDTVEARINVVAGSGGGRAGTITVSLDGRTLATASVDSLPPFSERPVVIRSRIEGAPGPAVFRAVVTSPQDAEPENDSLAVAIDLSRAASAVFVSTSPDFDARYALAVLRGALAIPTRGFFRVAPGEWRIEGALTPVPEAEVRQAVREAPVAILHGDTAAFGPPRTMALGPLALIVATQAEGNGIRPARPRRRSQAHSPVSSGTAFLRSPSRPRLRKATGRGSRPGAAAATSVARSSSERTRLAAWSSSTPRDCGGGASAAASRPMHSRRSGVRYSTGSPPNVRTVGLRCLTSVSCAPAIPCGGGVEPRRTRS